MSATAIEWTEETWNPTTGCDRVSAGCDNCYALTMARRLKAMGSAKYQRDGDPRTSGPGFGVSVHSDVLPAPVRWRKPRKVFVNSTSDLFHDEVPDRFIADVFAVMAITQRHTYQVLTKRHARMRALLLSPTFFDLVADAVRVRGEVYSRELVGWPLPNVHLGVSAEDQRWAAIRIPHLLSTPAAVRFVSAEPLLGPLRIDPLWSTGVWGPGLDWVIIGGESGRGARPMETDWARSLVRDCRELGIAPFVKQLGSVWDREHGRRGKGGDMATWPEDLRIREFPAGAR